MPATTVTCPACKASLILKGPTPVGVTQANCPKCRGVVRLHTSPEAESQADRTAAFDSPAEISSSAVVLLESQDVQVPHPATVTTPTGSQPSPPEFPFLALPQQPDEIGRLASYRVLRLLGQGGMGVVFLAEDPALRRHVALKVMLPQHALSSEAKTRFLREARAQAAVEHDHVVTIHQVGEDRGAPFLAMPLLKGQALSDALRANPQVPITEAVRIARETAEGLAAAHEQNLIHRDVKPGNLWLEGPRRRVKILDFGLARPATVDCEDSGDDPVTQKGAVIGTPAYMSPEQARGERVDARTDLFSLGCVLYQMLTGRRPFTGPNVTGLLIAVATETPPRPGTRNPSVTPELDALVMRLLAKGPAERPQSAGAVVELLRMVEAGLGVTGVVPIPLDPIPMAVADPWEDIELTEADRIVSTPAAEAPVRRKPRRWVWVGLVVAFLAVAAVAADVIIKIRNKDGTQTEIKVPDDATAQGTKDSKTVAVIPGKGDLVQAKLPKAGGEPRAVLDPDRKAAEWVISIGGMVGVNEQTGGIRAIAELPREAFQLTSVLLEQNEITDTDLAHFKDCKNLTGLRLNAPQVSDTGLAYFKDCKNLTRLYLYGTRVSDAGLVHFKDCKLIVLDLALTQVGDVGLAHLKDCKNLTLLDLGSTQVSDVGLAHFKDSNGLETLVLSNTRVSDLGLAYFKDCKNLTVLSLERAQISDVGLVHFKDCKNLTTLDLRNTQVSDTGLGQLKDCKKLTLLSLQQTKVTAAMIEELKKALPACRIEWDGGVIDPVAALAPDRKAAEWVISIGGQVSVNGQPGGIRAVANLPREPFQLTMIDLFRNEQVNDAGLAHFKDCKTLTHLHLRGEDKVTDAGLANFKDCKNLTHLDLGGTPVSDAGLIHFKDCKNLMVLGLGDTKVNGAGLVHFKDCKNLTTLDLGGTPVSDAGLVHFRDCKSLTHLTVDCRKLSDTGLVPFRDCKGLLELSLKWVTDAGLAQFKDCKELTRLDVQGPEVSEVGLAHFKGCKSLTSLALMNGTPSIDAGLAHFKECRNLTRLILISDHVSDAGLAHFRDCKNLTYLYLVVPKVTDAGLAHFKDCKNLTQLALTGAQLGDAGLAHFKDCKNLTQLALTGAQLGDAGLDHFKDCKDLTRLVLRGTKVTPAKIEEWKKALPKCKIEWDDKIIEPRAGLGPDRRTADRWRPAWPFRNPTNAG